MMPLADLFVHVYVLVDDAIKEGKVSIPHRPGPKPACSDAEVLTIALVRHLLGRPSEKAFLEELRREWRHYFPRLLSQSQLGRRLRWLWGAFEALRERLLAHLPQDTWQQVEATALPVKHPSRVRGPDQWQGPGGLVAGFGWDAAHSEWTCGFRLALRTELGSRLVRAWGIVPAAIDERQVADELLVGAGAQGLLLDRGFQGRAWQEAQRGQGRRVVLMPGPEERRRLPRELLRPIAKLRGRIETTVAQLMEQLGLARHGAKSFWGLLTRTAAAILAHTIMLLRLV